MSGNAKAVLCESPASQERAAVWETPGNVERAATLVNPVKAERHPCYADAAQAFYAAEVLKEQARRKGHRAITALFPDDGPLRRNLYPKQLEFFRASLDHRELLFMAANRTGKTLAGCY